MDRSVVGPPNRMPVIRHRLLIAPAARPCWSGHRTECRLSDTAMNLGCRALHQPVGPPNRMPVIRHSRLTTHRGHARCRATEQNAGYPTPSIRAAARRPRRRRATEQKAGYPTPDMEAAFPGGLLSGHRTECRLSDTLHFRLLLLRGRLSGHRTECRLSDTGGQRGTWRSASASGHRTECRLSDTNADTTSAIPRSLNLSGHRTECRLSDTGFEESKPAAWRPVGPPNRMPVIRHPDSIARSTCIRRRATEQNAGYPTLRTELRGSASRRSVMSTVPIPQRLFALPSPWPCPGRTAEL